LWDQPFELAADGETLTAVGAALQVEFTRRITPTPRGLRLEYSATALAQPTPFLWAAHPQFSAPAGTRVELEGDVERIVDVLAEPALEAPWTAAAATIDTLAPGRCRKLYVSPEQPARSARLIRPGYPALRMRWSEACPYVGLWFDAGAFAHEPVIAIEPATAYYDDLARASLNGTAPILLPGTPLRWWVELEAE
ncbi:aldose epimerase family protein, partial [Leucobacter sp. BZR 635]